MIYICQPYYDWDGHFSQYLDNLLSNDSFSIIISRKTTSGHGAILKGLDIDYNRSVFNFAFLRVYNSILINIDLIRRVKRNDIVHFIEFEPIGIFIFTLICKKKGIRVVQTIHSFEAIKGQKAIKNSLFRLHRMLFWKALNRLILFNHTVVVHRRNQKLMLDGVYGNEIKVISIPYPTPFPRVGWPRILGEKRRIIIFGLIREDKGIYEFLCDFEKYEIEITIAGKILDDRIYRLMNVSHYIFIDKYLKDNELDALMYSHDFALLPYKKDYTGGAGPFKDALAYGLPVIIPPIPVFEEVLGEKDVGFVYHDIDQIHKIVNKTSSEEYFNKSKQAIEYSKDNNWKSMKTKYMMVYNNMSDG